MKASLGGQRLLQNFRLLLFLCGTVQSLLLLCVYGGGGVLVWKNFLY